MFSRALELRAVHRSAGHSYLTKNDVFNRVEFFVNLNVVLVSKRPILRMQKNSGVSLCGVVEPIVAQQALALLHEPVLQAPLSHHHLAAVQRCS